MKFVVVLKLLTDTGQYRDNRMDHQRKIALIYHENIEYKNDRSVNLGKMKNQWGFRSTFSVESAGLGCQQRQNYRIN